MEPGTGFRARSSLNGFSTNGKVLGRCVWLGWQGFFLFPSPSIFFNSGRALLSIGTSSCPNIPLVHKFTVDVCEKYYK